MLCKGIPNPALLELLASIRHTNSLVMAGRGFLVRMDDTVQIANLVRESA